MKYPVVSLLFFLGTSLFSCHKNDPSPPSSTVFLSGFSGASGVYWKNGIIQAPLTEGTYSTEPTCIFASGSDVHLAGTGNNGSHNFAVYWKNGVATNLTDGTYNAEANAITVSGADIYIAGRADSLGYSTAVYWKNGVVKHLPHGVHASSIAVSGSDVYIAGNSTTGTGAVYWKNEAAVMLPNGDGANAIMISGSDVYVAGTMPGTLGKSIAVYWKNGTPTAITDGNIRAEANSLFVSGTDVYVAGVEIDGSVVSAMYWKNGVATTLAPIGQARGIQIFNNDIYVAGSVGNDIPAYWKNGVVTNLSVAGPGLVTGIFVK